MTSLLGSKTPPTTTQWHPQWAQSEKDSLLLTTFECSWQQTSIASLRLNPTQWSLGGHSQVIVWGAFHLENIICSFDLTLMCCSQPLPPVPPLRDYLQLAPVRTKVAGVGGVDSNFLVQMTPCVTSHLHSDLPAIMVFIEYLCALEASINYTHKCLSNSLVQVVNLVCIN